MINHYQPNEKPITITSEVDFSVDVEKPNQPIYPERNARAIGIMEYHDPVMAH